MFFFCSTCLTLSATENWPQFRGPTGDGIVENAKNLPTEWSEEKNILWKKPIDGKAWSSPVIWGEQVWVTNATEDGKKLSALCFNKKTGELIHDLLVFEIAKPQFCIAYNSYGSSTPTIEEGKIYVHFGSPGTACIDTKTGKKIWERTDIECDHFRGPGSSPVIVGDKIFLTFDGADKQFVMVLNKKNGETIWKKDREIKYAPSKDGDIKKAYSTPTILKVGDKLQAISPAAEATIAYDLETGAEQWRVVHGGMNEACRPVVGHGLVFLSSGHTKNLLAIKVGSGDLSKEIAWRTNKGVPTRPSFTLKGDLLFLLSDEGIASCFDAKTGKQHWQERLGGKAFSASPILVNDMLYCNDEAGRTHLISASDKYQVIGTNDLANGCMSSLAVSGDTLFLRTKKHLYAIGKK
jgi:outer membrane protein assembly factor BamB